MSNQDQIRPDRRDDGPDDDGAGVPPAPQGASVEADIDGILDEIDGVLETNAEEFVRTFVQKGGQ